MTQLTTTRHHSFAAIAEAETGAGLAGVGAEQTMTLYRAAAAKESPVILELGTEMGLSTTAFLQACAERGGRVVSVDINDCSDISESPQWSFVRADSTDVELITQRVPALRGGIDVLYIDSLHRLDHVEKELTRWFPFLKMGCSIFFDDVDAAPYRRRQRKDSYTNERNWEAILQYVQAFFYANIETTRLHVTYGSTGLAHLIKYSPMGSSPLPPDWGAVRRRRDLLDLRYRAARLDKRLRQRA